MAGRPNIVIICTDQHRFDAVSTHPGSAAVTPHLERLAAAGTVFDHCYSPSPVCAPARASMLTGQYPHRHGLWANGVTLPADASLVSAELAEAGYRTGLVGKLHLAAAFQGRTEEQIADGFELRRWAHDPFHGSPDNAYHQWLRDNHPALWQSAVGDVVTPDQEGFVHADTAFDAMPTEAHYSTWVAEETIGFLESEDERPFFVVANFFDPHHPFVAPQEYVERFPPGSVPPPVGGPAELASKPDFQTESSGCSYAGHGPSFTDFDAAGIDEIRRTYYASVTLADDCIGRILALLDQPRFRDTLVIFTSDHGELLGDHAMLLKGPMMYDVAVRVPMIMRWPGQVPAGERVAAQVGLHDVARTVREAAALPAVAADQGLDLVAVSDGRAEGRDWSWSEYRDSGYPNSPPVYSTMLRWGPFKIILWHGDPATGREPAGELYDLEADPDELTNLFDDPDHLATRARLLQRWADTAVALEDRTALRVAPW